MILPLEVDSQPDCFRNAASVWQHYPDSWATWKNHKGNKCWFPKAKRVIYAQSSSRVAQLAERRSLKSEVVGADPTTAAKKPTSTMVVQRVLSAQVPGSSPGSAATERIRTKLEEWLGVMPANEYVARMWPYEQ